MLHLLLELIASRLKYKPVPFGLLELLTQVPDQQCPLYSKQDVTRIIQLMTPQQNIQLVTFFFKTNARRFLLFISSLHLRSLLTETIFFGDGLKFFILFNLLNLIGQMKIERKIKISRVQLYCRTVTYFDMLLAIIVRPSIQKQSSSSRTGQNRGIRNTLKECLELMIVMLFAHRPLCITQAHLTR